MELPLGALIGGGVALLVAAAAFIWYSKKLQARLAAGDARLRAIFANSPFAVALLDKEGRYLGVNRAHHDLLGYPEEELRGSSFLGCIQVADAARAETVLEDIRDGRATGARLEQQWLRSDGQAIWTRTAISVDGDITVLVLDDMTDQRRSEQERRVAEEHREAETRRMRCLYAITRVLTDADTLADVAPDFLQAICEQGAWDFGSLWLRGSDGCLRTLAVRHAGNRSALRFAAQSERAELAAGDDLPGRALAEGEIVWTEDASLLLNLERAGAIDTDGLRTIVCVPITQQDRVSGVLELVSRQVRAVDVDLVQLLTDVASEVGSFLNRVAAAESLREREERYRLIDERSKDAVITIDDGGRIESVNRAAEVMFGYLPSEMIGRPIVTLLPEWKELTSGWWTHQPNDERSAARECIELRGRHRMGRNLVLETSIAEFTQHDKRVVATFLRDVTERKQAQQALAHQALHDTLTDLPNRTLLRDRLERSISVARRHETSVALLFMDLDRFKEVNDTFGHHHGDVLLQQVARRLEATLRESDTVARLGGDEFAVLLPMTDAQGAASTARRILATLRETFSLDGQSFDIDASIGIALYPDQGTDASTLMRQADVAMYRAKRTSSGFAMYAPNEDQFNSTRLVLISELRRAIEDGQLCLHYQPQLNLRNGSIEQVEALVRWNHPTRGLLSPDNFIQTAEESGVIRQLTTWAINEAMRQQHVWRQAGIDLRVAVNLSVRTLHDPQLLETISTVLQEWQADSSALLVEITESALMANPDLALQVLRRLHDDGIWVALDDFGTGYSSLEYLKRLPIDELKIDRSFVTEMASNRDDTSIVRSVIELGHSLGLHVVAEGVENKRTVDMLEELGADMAQGYYISRPLPVTELTPWLLSTRPRALGEVS